MRAWTLALVAVAGALAAPAVEAKTLLALPIAPGVPGNGPWTIAVWPYEGCADCAQSDADRAAFAKVRDAVLSGDYAGTDTSALVILLLPEEPFSPASTRATPAELHQLVAGCSVGSEGILRQSRGSEMGVAYGLGFDCPGDEHRRWMSVRFEDGRPMHIYYLPREPIWVIEED